MKTFQVSWGGFSQTVSAHNESAAWASFCDAQQRCGNSEIYKHPGKHTKLIKEIKHAITRDVKPPDGKDSKPGKPVRAGAAGKVSGGKSAKGKAAG